MSLQENILSTERTESVKAVDYGIGPQSIHESAHIAYFWENEKEFDDAVQFLAVGLKKGDHCVIFGHDEANRKVCRQIEELGFDLPALIEERRVQVLGAKPSGDETLGAIGAVFQQAMANGAPLIRLLGNIGWGKPGWPDDADILAFEAKVTDATKQFPCVVVCMYDLPSLPGHIVQHGGFETHPHLQIAPGPLRDNPHYKPTQVFLDRLESIASEIAERKRKDDALQRSEERFRFLFEHSFDAILLSSPEGKIEAANPAACAMFGRTEAEICRLGREALVDSQDPRLPAFLEERTRVGRVRSEINLKRKDGSTFPGEVSSAFYQDFTGATKAAVIIRDISERRRSEEALRAVTESTASATGADFFQKMVRHIAGALNVRYAFVTECTNPDNTHVRTLAFWNSESFCDEVAYGVKNTPCERVVGGEICCYPEKIQALFPEDKDLVSLAAEGYLAAPLFGAAGNIIGHLAVLDTEPVRASLAQMSILKIFAARAGAELERVRAQKDVAQRNAELNTLLEIDRAIGRHLERDQLFGALANCLNRVMPAERFGIEIPIDGDKLQGHILSAAAAGQPTAPTILPAAGTACDWVMQTRQWFIAGCREEFRERFPVTYDVMTGQGMESLCAVALVSGERNRGALFFMTAAKDAYRELRREFLEQVANQIAIAVENVISYEEIAALNATIAATAARRRTLLEINNAVVTKLTRDDLLAAVCAALAEAIWFDRLALSLYDPELAALRIVTVAGPYRREDYTPIGRILRLDNSPVGQAFERQQPVVRRDLEAQRLTASEQRAYGHGFRSLCALPLVIRGKSIGAFTIGSLTRFQYSETDAEFLMEVANQIAIAVDNMNAHEETEALKARFQAETVYLQEEIRTEHNFEEIIGQSAPVRELLRKVEQVAPTEASVLICGETGTGKELLARAVHDRSKRKDRALVKVNCGSIPSGLVESELFGHEKGAFTGAIQQRIGRFELAHGGTIFLDEVTELPLDTQVKLLRVLQEGEFERVGSSKTIKVDVRVIAATNRELTEVVSKGSFRADLYYRLNVFPLESPPLRERKNDIPLLVNFFLSRFGKKIGKEVRGVSQKSMDSLVRYRWPGNIRELQNVIERAVVLAVGPVVQVDDSLLSGEAGPAEAPTIDSLENHERAHILRALNETNWVIHGKKGAAELLGINPSTLRSRMEKLAIKKNV